ncbi:MAG: GlsB/YeaQ/YmgE family stress response membrane protein [Hyphomicrobiaceae bacterium]
MDATAIIVMLVVGAIAGWLASLVVGGPWGLIGYIVVGIIGGVVGGWLLNVAKVNINLGSPILNQIVTGAIGAIVLILIARLIL